MLRDRTGSVLRLESRLDLDHQRGRGKGEQAQLITSVYRGVACRFFKIGLVDLSPCEARYLPGTFIMKGLRYRPSRVVVPS